jgi:uncharacterized membrane protein YbhN (UPF0104 family)
MRWSSTGHVRDIRRSRSAPTLHTVIRTLLRRRLATTVLLLAVVAGVGVTFAQRDALVTSLRTCGRLDREIALVASALAVLGAVNRGLQTRRAYASAGLDLEVVHATTLTATSYSGNKFAKSGGLVGLAVHLHDARRRQLDPTRTIAAYIVITLSGAFGAIGLGALVLATVGLPSFLAALVAAVATGWITAMLWSRGGTPRSIVRRRVDRAAGRFGSHVDIDDLGVACRSIAGARRQLAWVGVHAVIGKLLGAVLLALVLRGLDVTALDTGATIRLYALTLAAAALGPLPAGLGTTEASLAAMLVAAGVDPATGLAVAMAFRAFDLWLPVALGGLVAPFVFGVGQPAAGRVQVEHPSHEDRVPQLAIAASVVPALAAFDGEAR